MASSWDDMKRVREDEYFHKEEAKHKTNLKKGMSALDIRYQEAKEKLSGFKKGVSPITGAPLFKAVVQGHIVLDCPEDDMILMSHTSLLQVMETLQNGDKQAINAWKAFLENSYDSEEK